jgi:hypothetical protein
VFIFPPFAFLLFLCFFIYKPKNLIMLGSGLPAGPAASRLATKKKTKEMQKGEK